MMADNSFWPMLSSVSHGTAYIPWIKYEQDWYPICGHYFWNNNHGASTFCKKLGFLSGSQVRTEEKYGKDAMPVGGCSPAQSLTQCTGGGNAWGNLGYNNKQCGAGKSIGVKIVCTGGAANPSSCEQAVPWNLALKTNGDSTFGYSSSYWTNTKLLNENDDFGTPGNAKYDAFNTASFNKVKICVGSAHENCVEHTLSNTYPNAKSLFSAGYIKDGTFSQKDFNAAFGPAKGSYQDCGMQRPGFNIQCNDGNKARWGYCINCASQGCQTRDNQDADAAIGLGINGQSTPKEMGAGWTNYFASGQGTCKANSMTAKNVWFYVVKEATTTTQPVRRLAASTVVDNVIVMV